MFCPKCGTKIPDDSDFCFKCGAPVDMPIIKTDADIPANNGIQAENRFGENVMGTKYDNTTTNPNPIKKINGSNKKIIAIISGAIVLIAVAVLLTIIFINKNHTAPGNNTSDQNDTMIEEPSNTEGNTPGNIVCRGLATIQNDTIYYFQTETEDTFVIKSMDINGGDEKELYSLNDLGFDLNVIGENLYFVSYLYDENDDISGSHICCYNLDTSTTKELYTSTNTIFNLYVTEDNIYFIDSSDDEKDKIISANSDGSNAVTIKEKSTLYNFIINDSSIYYGYNETIARCDLNGDNDQKIYTSSSTTYYSAYAIANSKLYVAAYTTDDYSVLKSMDLDGSNQTQVIKFEKKEWIQNLNIVDNQIYYISGTLNNDYDEFTSGEICRMDLDGSNEKTIASKDKELLGLNITGHWLFYYNEDKGTLIKVNLLTT